MHKLVVTGVGTGVGKTVVSAILTDLLEADYWKPIHSGPDDERDVEEVKRLVGGPSRRYHDEAYCLKTRASPHYAAQKEGVLLDASRIQLPKTEATLVIEGTGGLFCPFDDQSLVCDHFRNWQADWVIVSQNYLGSINHTLLTVSALQNWGIQPVGIVFNGEDAFCCEPFIQRYTGLSVLGRLRTESHIDSQMIRRYSRSWRSQASLPPHWILA